MKYLAILLAGLVLTGCASTPVGNPDPRDPWEKFNRKSFAFNDALDRAIAKPVAKGYVKVTPKFVRTGVSNFFSNLDTITTVFNDVLQGKMRQAGNDSGRFLLNTTLGFGGLFDPASAAGLDRNDEDFGQTLGKWGVKSGPYLMLPILGPSTVRDAFGRIPDQFTYPPNYLKDSTSQYVIRAVSFVDLRASLLDLEKQMNESPDRYAFVRNAWLQNREFKVTDGGGENLEDEALKDEALNDDSSKDDGAPAADAPAPNQ